MTPTRKNGHLVEQRAAAEVETGWKLLFNGRVGVVTDIAFYRPKEGEVDRQVRIWLSPQGMPISGDEGQTVYRVIEEHNDGDH